MTKRNDMRNAACRIVEVAPIVHLIERMNTFIDSPAAEHLSSFEKKSLENAIDSAHSSLIRAGRLYSAPVYLRVHVNHHDKTDYPEFPDIPMVGMAEFERGNASEEDE